MFTPTPYYPNYVGRSMKVTKVAVRNAAASYLSRFKVVQTETDASILELSLQDYSVNRAKDMINKFRVSPLVIEED